MMQQHEFENGLSDYLRGDLLPEQQRQMEGYIEQHPETLEVIAGLQEILPLAERVRQDLPAAELLEQANAGLLARLEREQPIPKEPRRWPGWLRPAYLSASAALLAVIAAGLLWRETRSVALAGVAEKMMQLQSFRVEGWVLNEKGVRTPYRQWLKVPGFFRAEVGEGAEQRIVVSDGTWKWIQLPGGAVYQEAVPPREARTIQEIGSRLHLNDMVAQRIEENAHQFHREDLGEIVRFTIWYSASLGSGPSDQQLQVEVDRESRLPRRIVFSWRQGEEWQVLSELNYGEYNADFPAAMFQVDSQAAPVPQELLETLWYERSISPLFALFPVSPMPADGLEVLFGPFEARGKGSSGMSQVALGGIAYCDFHHYPLKEIVKVLTGLPAETADEVLGQQGVTLKVNYLEKLPWPKIMARMGPILGVRAELVQHQATRTRVTFVQDGRDFPVKTRWWGGGSLHVSTQDSVSRYTFEGAKLTDLIFNLFFNSRHTGFNPDLDTLVFRWDGPPEQNPFAREVDLEWTSSGAWEENYPPLQERFGVHLERIAEPYTYAVLVLTPHADLREDPPALQVGGAVLDAFPNPGNPAVEIPYILDREAQARVRVFNALGQVVRTLDLGEKPAGSYSAYWNAQDEQGQPVASGRYLYRLEVDGLPTPARKLSIAR